MTEIVVHRGIGTQNTVEGIVEALRSPDVCRNVSGVSRCETDLLWHQGRWWICHDFETLHSHPDVPVLSELMTGLLGMSSPHDRVRWDRCLILDIKWDWIHNREDSWAAAWEELLRILGVCTTSEWRDGARCSILLQLNHLSLLDMVSGGDAPPFRIGIVMTPPLSLWPLERLKNLDFMMIDLAGSPVEDIRTLRESMPSTVMIFGYTCPSPNRLGWYAHLTPWLTAVVCDIPSCR